MATKSIGNIVPVQGLKIQKRTLRKSLATTLAQLTPASLDEQSEAIAARVLSLPAFKQASSICCYLHMPSGEVRTTALVDTILSSDKKLFVPKVQSKDGAMEFFRVYSSQDLAALPANSWGIREPPEMWQGQHRSKVFILIPGNDSEYLDIILVPGVAFDRTFARLGHGKGYYDRFLTSYVKTERASPLLVGLALREQMLPIAEIPMQEHDWRLDMIITPDETLVTRNSDSSE
ncbi:hypothetical protein D9619_008067 [Psilocybe cf. subviscida]|uniref:5-formyltetrahydrofolate cyclo-ligase n=1 Tax=Psilocybe cf. subviscida TaxID=2480587 RepID=A0A8H5ESI1_9AGAR|nr:hypothetical protein D9619_008067 [Psilocybe cf. subviscida]